LGITHEKCFQSHQDAQRKHNSEIGAPFKEEKILESYARLANSLSEDSTIISAP
jgi:hypothetical protein